MGVAGFLMDLIVTRESYKQSVSLVAFEEVYDVILYLTKQ